MRTCNVEAQPEELTAAAESTVNYLQSQAARLTVGDVQVREGRVETEITVENLGGHKLPTAYPVPARVAACHVARRGQSRSVRIGRPSSGWLH